MPPRLRELELRDLELELRDVFAPPLLARFGAERFAAGLRAADVRLDPELDDFARLDGLAVERFALDLRAPVERLALDLRADFDALREPDEEDADAVPSIDHLPDITRCAASATASAMSEPSFAALDATLLAACCAVSAASRPASRIFFRAAGLAAIAAAAAVSPAASISLLIAALASLSTVLSLELEPDDDELERGDDELERDFDELEREELLRADLAIFSLLRRGKDTLMPFRFPNEARTA